MIANFHVLPGPAENLKNNLLNVQLLRKGVINAVTLKIMIYRILTDKSELKILYNQCSDSVPCCFAVLRIKVLRITFYYTAVQLS